MQVSTDIPTIELLAKKLEQMELRMQQHTPMQPAGSATSTSAISTSTVQQHIYPQRHGPPPNSTSASSMSTSSMQHHSCPQHQNSLRAQQYNTMPTHMPMQQPMQSTHNVAQPLPTPTGPANALLQQQNWQAPAATQMHMSKGPLLSTQSVCQRALFCEEYNTNLYVEGPFFVNIIRMSKGPVLSIVQLKSIYQRC